MTGTELTSFCLPFRLPHDNRAHQLWPGQSPVSAVKWVDMEEKRGLNEHWKVFRFTDNHPSSILARCVLRLAFVQSESLPVGNAWH